MVVITEAGGQVVFRLKGWHIIWAMKKKIVVQKNNIVKAYAFTEHPSKVSGVRMPGTYLPGVITAGTYLTSSGKQFWDVCKTEKSIVVELTNEKYTKIVVQVADVVTALQILS